MSARTGACAAQLHEAMQQGQLVRLSTRFEPRPLHGYVRAVGPVFVLLAVISDRIWLDGFVCLRIADCRKLRADPYAAFLEAALHKRGETAPGNPGIDLSSITALLGSAARAFPLITIQRGTVDPEVCQIGKVVALERHWLRLREIDASACWDEQSTGYRLREITEVSFGADYEDALFLVGGEPPAAV